MATNAAAARPLLVYLDTANLATYAGAPPEDRQLFREAWHRRQATLALSFVHIIELRQHASATERDERYSALADFLPIRTTMSLRAPNERVTDASDREILAAALRRGVPLDAPVVGIASIGKSVVVDPFPWTIETMSDLDEVRGAESPWFAQRAADMRAAITVGTIGQTRQKGSRAPDQRLLDFPDAPLTPAQTVYLLRQVDAQFGPLVVALGQAADVTAAIVNVHRKLILRESVVGPRRARVERLEAQIGRSLNTRDLQRPLRELMFEANFRSRVRAVLDQHCSSAPLADRAAVAATISLQECPGRWLWHAVDDQAFKAEAEPAPSNYWDFDQTMYLPYVDRFFTDRRIATFLEQALRPSDRPHGVTAAGVRRNADHLQQIAERLD